MRSGTTLNMKCLWANWFGLRTSIKSGGLKTGKAIAFAIIASCLSLVVITPHSAIETVAAKTAAEERAERIEAALFTRAEFFGVQAIIPYPTVEARARLAEVRKLYPQDSQIEQKLASLSSAGKLFFSSSA